MINGIQTKQNQEEHERRYARAWISFLVSQQEKIEARSRMSFIERAVRYFKSK